VGFCGGNESFEETDRGGALAFAETSGSFGATTPHKEWWNEKKGNLHLNWRNLERFNVVCYMQPNNAADEMECG
jgi:hypothetical protein